MHNIFFCGKRADRSCQLVMNNVNDLKSFSGIPSIGIYRERGRTVSTTIYHLVIGNVAGLETTSQIRFATCYFFLFFLVAVARRCSQKKICRMLRLIGFDSDGNNTSQRRMRITPSINFSFFYQKKSRVIYQKSSDLIVAEYILKWISLFLKKFTKGVNNLFFYQLRATHVLFVQRNGETNEHIGRFVQRMASVHPIK